MKKNKNILSVILNLFQDLKSSLLAYCFFLLPFALISISCEKEIKLKVSAPSNAYVVEGHIENGLPPYVLLTKNSGFFGNININDISSDGFWKVPSTYSNVLAISPPASTA